MMKNLSKILLMGAVSFGLFSCQNDEPANIPSIDSSGSGDIYTRLTLNLPASTRSTTEDPGSYPSQSSNGFEYGQDFENNIDQISVVLAEKASDGSYKYVTSSTSSSVQDVNAKAPTYIIQFESDDLKKKAGSIVYVFAYCNPDNSVSGFINGLNAGDTFADHTGTIAEGSLSDSSLPVTISIAQPKSFLMTNAEMTPVALPSYETMMGAHTSKETAFNLGNVRVERLASRFDFAATTIDGQSKANVYPIKEQVSNTVLANIELLGISLFNEAREFYYLPRVSSDSLASVTDLCGQELTDNYVVSPNLQTKRDYADGKTAVPSHLFHFPVSTAPAAFSYTLLSDVANGLDDDHTSTQNPTWNPQNADYKIWRYATENTIPGIAAQRHGLSTGVVFKAEIKSLPGSADAPARKLAAAMADGETVYAYSDNADKKGDAQLSVVLGSAKDVHDYAATHNNSAIRVKYVNAVKAGYFSLYKADGSKISVNSENDIFSADVAKVTGQKSNTVAEFEAESNFGFVAYAPTLENGQNRYYVYYYYYNRHNDNNKPQEMGVMEYATVRNNIYKLKVDNVLKLGVPGDTPPDPWTPNETPEVYFKVSVHVLDWVVRKNNIIL